MFQVDRTDSSIRQKTCAEDFRLNLAIIWEKQFMRLLAALLILPLASCATYQPPANATSRIKFVGNHYYAYIGYGDSCKARDMVGKEFWSGAPIKDSTRVWIEQGIDTTGTAFGMKCGFRYSFVPLPNTTYVSEYSMHGSCEIALYRLNENGERIPESSARREPDISCLY